jgi:hypothetical protein
VISEYNADGGGKIRYYKIGPGAKFFIVAKIDENGATTSGDTAVDISPPIAHHPTAAEIESESPGRVEQHSGRWLAPCGSSSIITDLNVINSRDQFTQSRVHRLYYGSFLDATSDIGLVRNDD